MDLSELMHIIEHKDELKPIYKGIAEILIDIADEIEPVANKFFDVISKTRSRVVQNYVSYGFTIDQAIAMAIADMKLYQDITPKNK